MAGPTDMIEGNKLVALELIVHLRSFPVKFRSSHRRCVTLTSTMNRLLSSADSLIVYSMLP